MASYTVESSTHSLRDLRRLQDWFIRYQLNGVPGVTEVASVGSHVQQYQIDVDPHRLRGFGLALGDVVRAVQQSNANVGGNVVESNGMWSIVRGVGLVQSAADLANVSIDVSNGVPVFVRQVAEVRIGDAFRVASLVKGRHEAVGGGGARAGVNTQEVVDAVKARIRQIEPGLPQGVRIVPFYDDRCSSLRGEQLPTGRPACSVHPIETVRTRPGAGRPGSARSPVAGAAAAGRGPFHVMPRTRLGCRKGSAPRPASSNACASCDSPPFLRGTESIVPKR